MCPCKKLLPSLLVAATMIVSAAFSTGDVQAPAKVAGAVRGRYVEARTATVFAGACHIQGEYDTRGREAVLAWSFESGEHAGVPLAGLAVAVAVTGDANLAEPGAERESVVYVPEDATETQRGALVAWLRAEHAAALGEVLAVRAVPLELALEGERFRVRAGDAVELSGSLLPDRACCSMPYEVGYETFDESVRAAGAIVGNAERFASREPALPVRWSTAGENCAFAGSFPAPPETPAVP